MLPCPGAREAGQHVLALAKYYSGSRNTEKGTTAVDPAIAGTVRSDPDGHSLRFGILLLLHRTRGEGNMLLLHQASFVVWFACMTIHVLVT